MEVSLDYPYFYRWNRMERKGQPCRVLCRGSMNSCMVEFEDGYKAVTSRNAIAKRKDIVLSHINELAIKLADIYAKTLLESEWIRYDDNWMTLQTATDRREVDEAALYLEMRGKLKRHPKKNHLVRFV